MLNRIYIIAREYAENSGSYANFIEELSRYASSKGCRIVILCGAGIEKHGIETVSYGEIHRFRFPKIKLPLLGMNLDYAALALHTWNFFRKNKPTENDIIIANGRAALGVLKRRYVLRAGQPAFTFLTNMEIAKGEVSLVTRIARFVHFTIQAVPECLCMRYATACLFPSEETMNLWTKHYKSGKKPSFIPFAGVRFSKMDGGRKLPIEGRTILFISAGTERIRKGVMHLERALPGIFTRFEDARLIQVGEKMEWNVPKEYAGRITATGRISWNGMKDYYKTAGLMVSCALNEGFPNTILEAMAAGTPIVSSDINGITDYITDKKEGLIYKRGDTEGLKKAITYMLENPEDKERMAKAAKEKIKPLDYPQYLERLLAFLEETSGEEEDGTMQVSLLKERKEDHNHA